jgi:hypothetical protein
MGKDLGLLRTGMVEEELKIRRVGMDSTLVLVGQKQVHQALPGHILLVISLQHGVRMVQLLARTVTIAILT